MGDVKRYVCDGCGLVADGSSNRPPDGWKTSQWRPGIITRPWAVPEAPAPHHACSKQECRDKVKSVFEAYAKALKDLETRNFKGP